MVEQASFPRESEENNVEYKRFLDCEDDEDRLKKLANQIIRRINSDNDDGYCSGEALYYIGINDDGSLYECTEEEYNKSVSILDKILTKIDCVKQEISHKVYGNSHVGEFLIREKVCKMPIEVTVLMGGNVDSGKSSTLGCLISGEPDDGRGKSRLKIFNTKDEIKSGRTMSLAHHILGLDATGDPIYDNNYTWADIVNQSKKLIKFVDLAGHEKYAKTTYRGYILIKTGISLIMVGGNMGMTNMTREHIFLCINLRIPFCFVVTKMDICENRKNILEETLKSIKEIMNLPSVRKNVFSVESDDDVFTCAKNIHSLSVVPLFKISNVTMNGIDKLLKFLNLVPQKKIENAPQHGNDTEFYIDSTFTRKGFSCIIAGQLLLGQVKTGQEFCLGPDFNGNFKTVGIKGIHYNRTPIDATFNHSYYCFALKGVTRNEVRKGMVLINKPICFYEFEAKIAVHYANKKSSEKTMYSRSATIKVGYQPTVHILNIRQNARIVSISNKVSKRKNSDSAILVHGDRALVRFRFIYRPQYIKVGEDVLFTEGVIRSIGKITQVFPYTKLPNTKPSIREYIAPSASR